MAVEEEPDAGIPEWVVTFGDMMSLLLTFFIMLVSMSEIKEEERFQAMVESFRRQFGHDASMASMSPGKLKPRNSSITKLASQGRANRLDLMNGGDKVQAPEGDYPRVAIIRPGGKTGIGTVIFFAAGDARLSDKNRADLIQGVKTITGKPQIVEIRGHTSRGPLPPSAGTTDHWQLAYDRCRNTMQYLVEDLGIERDRLRLSLAADNDPLYLDADPIKLQKNPRVEVFMLEEVVGEMQSNRTGDLPPADDEPDTQTPFVPNQQ
jgi:chemotaxis protein MotB